MIGSVGERERETRNSVLSEYIYEDIYILGYTENTILTNASGGWQLDCDLGQQTFTTESRFSWVSHSCGVVQHKFPRCYIKRIIVVSPQKELLKSTNFLSFACLFLINPHFTSSTIYFQLYNTSDITKNKLIWAQNTFVLKKTTQLALRKDWILTNNNYTF